MTFGFDWHNTCTGEDVGTLWTTTTTTTTMDAGAWVYLDWLQSLVFFLPTSKEKQMLSGKNFLTGPTVSFWLVWEIKLSGKGSSQSQVRIIHLG